MAHTEPKYTTTLAAATALAELVNWERLGLDKVLDAIEAYPEPDRRLQAVPCDPDDAVEHDERWDGQE